MDTIQDMIAAQRGKLAAVLGELPAGRWDAPTLCAGWRVREVVAHITMPFRYSAPRFPAEAVRANTGHPWKPPGGGFDGALAHDVIHGLDITVPLGLAFAVPEERLRRVLPGSLAERSVRYFGTELSGIELRATDLDWSLGSGAPMTGAAQDLLLALCGRKLPVGHLHGDPAARFTAQP